MFPWSFQTQRCNCSTSKRAEKALYPQSYCVWQVQDHMYMYLIHQSYSAKINLQVNEIRGSPLKILHFKTNTFWNFDWKLHLIHSPMFINTSCCLYVLLWLIPCVLKFQITEVQSCSDDSPVKFSSEVVFYVDRYEIV